MGSRTLFHGVRYGHVLHMNDIKLSLQVPEAKF